ncbi:uncharacterized protein [Parasteatoda tepidariorum]|uniref:uncharacterized protein n=1 Tax=Parasteatoda tepidariorum TaxID=114398 RepID=UPI0039BD5C5F
MSESLNGSNLSKEISSSLNTLRDKIEDLEIRVGDLHTKQYDVEKDLESMRSELQCEFSPPILEEPSIIHFPEDPRNVDELKRILDCLEEGQKSIIESSQELAKQAPDSKIGRQIFKDIEHHISNRLEYFNIAKKLIEGPLVEEPPPPPPEEEKSDEKAKKSKKKKKKASKKKKQK